MTATAAAGRRASRVNGAAIAAGIVRISVTTPTALAPPASYA